MIVDQERKKYKTPFVKVVKFNTDNAYMQLIAGSDNMGIEPGGDVSDYDIEPG